MPQMDAFQVMMMARQMGMQNAEAETGIENPNIGWRQLSLEQTHGGYRDEAVDRALSTPQSPADPRWAARMPPPPCEQCKSDHKGNKVYNHPYIHPLEAQRAREFIEANGGNPDDNMVPAQTPTPIRQGVEREIVRRVAIYDSRTGFTVTVDEPPEWDTVLKLKLDRDQVVAMLPVLRTLGVKVKNLSEDEFEERDDAVEPASDPQPTRPAAGVGKGRSQEEVAREWNELLPGTTPPSLEPAGGHGAERADTDGQKARPARRTRTRKAS